MKFLYPLVLLVPLVLGMEWLDFGGHTLLFVLSALALIPLSALLGDATETVAEYTGPKIGGFLNATFGNAPELIITIVALREGLVGVVKASIAGSIIGNMLVVLGASILLGGLRHGQQRFDRQIASTNATMMSLAIVILMIPAVFEIGSGEKGPTHQDIVNLSDGASVVLILLYVLYLFATVFTKSGPAHHTDIEEVGDQSRRGLYLAVGTMLAITLAIVFMSEVLVGALEPTAESWGLSDLFIGLMLVPLVGNIAEHLVAVQMALRNKMDLSIGIAVGSGLQIALFVAPVLVLVSQFVGPEPMTLVFSSYELAALVGTVIVAVLISIDGRTRWLEGAQLLALYVVLGMAFFFVP